MTAAGIMAILGSYLVGGIPIGFLVGRAYGIEDIRKYGSGNIGASNVLRLIGVKAGLFVWIMDALKGFIPVLLARQILGLPEIWLAGVALAALVGHCFSLYLRFGGGRGVSTSLGVALGLDWRVGAICFGLWILVVAVTRYISLGSIIGVSVSPFIMALFHAPWPYIGCMILLAALVVWRHAPNIQRLLAGTERKIGQKEVIGEQGSQSAP